MAQAGETKGKPSKVLFFSHSSDLFGAERSLLELVRELTADHNTKCTVVLPSHGPLEQVLHQAGAATLIAPMHWWCAPAPSDETAETRPHYSQSLAWLNENLDLLRQIDPDVVLTNTLVIPWGALAASLLKRPHIWMVNEFGELDHGLEFFSPFHEILGFIEDASDKIVTCSKAIQQQLFPDVEAGKVRTIYYHIDVPDAGAGVPAASNGHFRMPDACHLAILGSVMKSKGQEDAVQAVIELSRTRKRKVELVIAGYAQPAFQTHLEHLIDAADAGDYIRILPFQENVGSILNAADIVLVCSRMEGFGRVTLEAMLMQKAVVAANTGGTREMILDGETGLLYTPGDHAQLAGQIETLLDDPNKRATLAQNAYRVARTQFSRQDFGGEYHALIMELTGRVNAHIEERSSLLASQYQMLLEQTEAAVPALTAQLAEKKQAQQQLEARLQEYKDWVGHLDEVINDLTAQLTDTINNKAWKTALFLRFLIAPPNSRRASALRGVLDFVIFQLLRVRPNRNPAADLALIQSSGMFDGKWYLSNNPDVARARVDPLLHYLNNGGFEGRDPGPEFSSRWYLDTYPDARAAGINPLVHYLQYGQSEGRAAFPSDALSADIGSGVPRGRTPVPVARRLRQYLQHHTRLSAFVRAIVPGSLRMRITDHMLHNEDGLDAALASRDGTPPRGHARSHEHNDIEYHALLRRSQESAQRRRKGIAVKVPRLIALGEDPRALMQAAAFIRLPGRRTPKVSIVIPVHNKANLLLECLGSLQNDPAVRNCEICVVDDGSDAATRDIMERITGITLVHNEERKGFGYSCNIGAAASRGEFLLFLNDDVQVTQGAIQALVDTFAIHSDAGAAGPKVLYPSGFLQEAGCAINRDGTITMIGHGDDPTLPGYNYMREVDLVSGVCLMLKKDQFHELGGFDDAYAIAYYEDVDLSFRLRQRGLKVVYNPDAVIVHHLSSTTSGLFGQSTKLELVARNRQKLLERWQSQIDALNQTRLIAFYLPQFHPIPENDAWWGKGFTEWTNVVRARPFFDGHYQPHLPADLGFYDLRAAQVMEQQAELAERYGIHGFCYDYYWFGGRRLLEMPLERMLETGRPDFPFCLCWANENWSRRWDGSDKDILIAQEHSADDDLGVIQDLVRYFKRPNYIRVDGKPMLLVYQVNQFPDFKTTAGIWRAECRRQGIGEIHLVLVETFELSFRPYDPRELGVDAAVEFPPHGKFEPARPSHPASDFRGRVVEYRNVALHFMQKAFPRFAYYKTVLPSWDNTPRRMHHAVVFANSSPGAYQAWLQEAVRTTHEQCGGDHRIVFINAWNEWAEGNHLEPDQRYGHGFLEATKNALEHWLIPAGQS